MQEVSQHNVSPIENGTNNVVSLVLAFATVLGGHGITFDQARVDQRTVLGSSLLRIEIHVDQTKPATVAAQPFEIVVA